MLLEAVTDDQAAHLLLPQHVHAQGIAELLVELVRAAARRHDAQLPRLGPVERLLRDLVLAHELDAVVDAIRLEGDEVQATPRLPGPRFAREVHQFGQRAPNLRLR